MKLRKLIIRVPKNEASFAYFQFEAYENLVFHSTLECDKAQPYRDILVFAPISMESDLRHMMKQLGQEFLVEYLEDTLVDDSINLIPLLL